MLADLGKTLDTRAKDDIELYYGGDQIVVDAWPLSFRRAVSANDRMKHSALSHAFLCFPFERKPDLSGDLLLIFLELHKNRAGIFMVNEKLGS